MRIFVAHLRRVFGSAFVGLALVCSSGCLATKLVTAPLNLAGTSVGVVGDTAEAVVKTSGKVIIGSVRATGSVADKGITAAGKLARARMVTFYRCGKRHGGACAMGARHGFIGRRASGKDSSRDAGDPSHTCRKNRAPFGEAQSFIAA